MVRELTNPLDKVILVDKPEGISSFGVVARIRGAISRKLLEQTDEKRKVKVGHAGTLDPFATGLLIVLIGRATKRANEFLKLDKEYLAELCLGKVSTTGDPEGVISDFRGGAIGNDAQVEKIGSENYLATLATDETSGAIVARKPPETNFWPSEKMVIDTLESFLGESVQTVPKFSAVKIQGRRAYDLARKGESFQTPSRKIRIDEIEMLEYSYPRLKIRARVSSGTYIRALAEDIGKKLGTGAYLTALRRTQIGNFRIEKAKTLEQVIREIEDV